MDRNETIDILNGMCERCLMKGLITTIHEAETLSYIFNRFRNNAYKSDEEYSSDILYLYNLAIKLHESGNITLEESHSIYSAILAVDRIEFVETDDVIDITESNEDDIETPHINIPPVVLKRQEKQDGAKNKRKKSKEKDGVVDVSEIVIS